MSARCLVQHVGLDGEMVRRVVVFDNAGENRVAKCLKVFQLNGNFALEAFDDEFAEYVRLSDSDTIVNGSKLLLVPLKSKVTESAAFAESLNGGLSVT